MVQPRKEQIQNLQTRHSRFVLGSPTPGAVSDRVSKTTVYAATVTDVPGGVDDETGSFANFFVGVGGRHDRGGAPCVVVGRRRGVDDRVRVE